MANVTVSTNPSTKNNTLTVNFTTDVNNITGVQLTKDGSNYISATSFTNTSATFNVASWSNGTYNNCYLKVIYTEASSGGSTGGDFSTESGSFGAILQSAMRWYIIGDSISDTGLIPQRKYMTVLGERFSNVTITNLGKDGSHYTNKTTGYQRFITQLHNHSTTYAPDIITIFGGVNDYIQSVPIGDASSTDNTNFYGAVKEFVSALNTKYPTSKKVFILPLNMRNGVFSTNANGTNSLGNTLANYRDALISVLDSNNMAYIDLHEDSELQPDLITSDGLHPNQDGHALLARKICASIVGDATGGGSTGGDSSGVITPTWEVGNISSSGANNDSDTSAMRTNHIEFNRDSYKYYIKVTSEFVGISALKIYFYNSDGTFNSRKSYSATSLSPDVARGIDFPTTTGTFRVKADFGASNSLNNINDRLILTRVAKESSGGGSTGTYTSAVIGDFTTVGNCSGISIDSSNNLVASSLGQWGMVKLNKTVSKLKFNVRGSQADYGALAWYIYNDNGDGTYNMIALGNIAGGENGKRFKMTIPGAGATQIDKLDIALINTGEQLTIENSGGTQTIKKADGSTLTTLQGNMSGWCGQTSASSPFCSNIQYIE